MFVGSWPLRLCPVSGYWGVGRDWGLGGWRLKGISGVWVGGREAFIRGTHQTREEGKDNLVWQGLRVCYQARQGPPIWIQCTR